MNDHGKVYNATHDRANGYEHYSTRTLRNMREHIRAELLEMFPDISGPDIACAMDDALADVWGPVDNYS